jgi:thiaminase/transcriptional activator TenA
MRAPSLSERLVQEHQATWGAMAAHPFVIGLADGTLPEAALRAWLQQDRLFVMAERRVVWALRAHGLPPALDEALAGLDEAMVREATMFAAEAERRGFPVEVEPWPVCLGYSAFLLAAAHDGVLDGLTAMYAAERAYLDTWSAVRTRSLAGSPYRQWIENWSSDDFRAFVALLGRELDTLTETIPVALTARLRTVFARAARFELAFWEMCWQGQGWPAAS